MPIKTPTGNNKNIIFNPKDDMFGNTIITINVSDTKEVVSQQFDIVVNSINDAPVSYDVSYLTEDILNYKLNTEGCFNYSSFLNAF